MSLQFRRFAIGGVALCLAIGAGPAFAADATKIADALVAAATASGDSQAAYDGATASGDDVTITNFKLTGKDGESATVPSIVITNAQPRDPGGFTASGISADNASMVSKDSTVKWGAASVADATVPSPEEIKAKAKIRPFSKLDIADLEISGGDLPAPLGISSISATIDLDEQNLPRDFTLSVASINVSQDLLADADEQTKQMLTALGYDSFVINLTMEGGYETGADTLTIRNFAIEAPDVGKLAFAGKVSGIKASDMASGNASSSDFSNGKLENLTIRFDNSGIVERALDMQAKMMGGSRQDVVAQLNAALPFMLNAINNPAFQDKVAKAGQAFLSDPKSVTITVMPAQPVAFDAIMSSAMSAPQTLPDTLGIEITANN